MTRKIENEKAELRVIRQKFHIDRNSQNKLRVIQKTIHMTRKSK